MRQAVILKNDCVFYLFKDPPQSTRNTRFATHILISKKCFYVACPVNTRGCLTGQGDLLLLTSTITPGSISNDE
jgi:hypothetical protein